MLMDQYSDGTGVLRHDFTEDNHPNDVHGVGPNYKYGDLDYFNISPPSASCTSIRLRTKDIHDSYVHDYASIHFDKEHKRPVVCLGINVGKKLIHKHYLT